MDILAGSPYVRSRARLGWPPNSRKHTTGRRATHLGVRVCVMIDPESDALFGLDDDHDLVRILLDPTPVSLTGIGAVITIDEGVSLIAHNRPSYDYSVWQANDGRLIVLDPDGNDTSSYSAGTREEVASTFFRANSVLRDALLCEELVAFVKPPSGDPVRLSRLYWGRSNPNGIDLVCRGGDGMESIAGCRIFLGRNEFNTWRAANGTHTTPPKTDSGITPGGSLGSTNTASPSATEIDEAIGALFANDSRLTQGKAVASDAGFAETESEQPSAPVPPPTGEDSIETWLLRLGSLAQVAYLVGATSEKKLWLAMEGLATTRGWAQTSIRVRAKKLISGGRLAPSGLVAP